MKKFKALAFVIICVSICAFAFAEPAGKVLPSWNETPNRERIIAFVSSVSDPAGPSYVPEEERIAVLDLDGTIFCEKPLYLQVLIAAERLYELAEKNSILRSVEPYASAWERDWDYISDHNNFLEMNLTAFEGATEEEYQEYAESYLTERKNPDFKVPYIELFYIPMLEFLEYLESNGFQVYIVSGSPQEFIRAFSKEKLNVALEKVIGDTISVAFQVRDGRAVFIRKHAVVEPEVLREGKPENIRTRIGRVPILAFGNSNDDIAMLESAAASGLPNLSLTLHHDDGEREYAYDKGADKVLEAARERGWATVSMKKDFSVIFNAGKK